MSLQRELYFVCIFKTRGCGGNAAVFQIHFKFVKEFSRYEKVSKDMIEVILVYHESYLIKKFLPNS